MAVGQQEELLFGKQEAVGSIRTFSHQLYCHYPGRETDGWFKSSLKSKNDLPKVLFFLKMTKKSLEYKEKF